MKPTVMCVLVPLILSLVLTGCTTYSAITGGSIPVGNGGSRSVIGQVILPGGSPAPGATVVVQSLQTQQIISTVSTDSVGKFIFLNVPATQSVEIVATVPGTSVHLKMVIPFSSLVTGNGTLYAGSVTAQSTVVARAIELEIASDASATNQIVGSQIGPLSMGIVDQNQNTQQQQQDATDNVFLDSTTKVLIADTTNSELLGLAVQVTKLQAQTTLTGLLGFLRVVQQVSLSLTPDQENWLIQSEIGGLTFTPIDVASALQVAGASNASTQGVQTASAQQRQVLPAFSLFGNQISPFEALSIAVSQEGQGGFQLSPSALGLFLLRLQS